MELIKGMELTDYHLNKLVDSISKEDYAIIRELHSDTIPNGEYSDRMILKFIICAVPNAARYTDSEILSVIRTKVSYPKLTEKKEILRQLKASNVTRPLLSKVAETFRKHKHCPILVKKNNDWCILVVLSELQLRLDCEDTFDWYVSELKRYVE